MVDVVGGGLSVMARRLHLGDALKDSSKNAGRFALSAVAAAVLCAAAPSTWALGLGRLTVESALGETLKAEIDVTSLTPEEAASLKVKVASPDAYHAAGVDYNGVLAGTQVALQHAPDGHTVLRLSSDRAVQEPFVDVILELSWSSGRLVREYTLLFDPPGAHANAPVPSVQAAPAISANPSTAPRRSAPVPAPAPAPAAAAEAPAPAAARAPRHAPVPAPASTAAAPAPASTPAGGADEVRVRQGDTLYRIATRTQRSGVSLDQMLVSLYRGNPSAFIDNNMNRLKAGVVLSVPSADTARQTSEADAHQLIVAQSSDFGAYRQHLASAVPSARTEEPTRQATGKVQAAVEDRKQAAQTSPDKLTLSHGALKPTSPEARLSKEAERKEASARVAELSRNVEELKRLSGANKAGATAPASAATKPAPGAVPASAPTHATTTPAKPAVTVPPVLPHPSVASAPLHTPAVVPPHAASSVLPGVAASAPHPAVAASHPRPRPRPHGAPVPVEEPSFFDNPLVLPVGGVALLGLLGLGFYRWRSRSKKDSGETSFLESRLQPDSFFGASGGQRIDTRDASGVSSSMSYSLSQLDAIGDVDPVAEADVYLAYGRDLQAEEILKEAMRSNPDRLAIRAKLLEVYAKRRDTKGFEQLATQMYALTRGEGEDWARAQELGRQIDPDHPLYQPGGHPNGAAAPAAPVVEAGPSTMPGAPAATQPEPSSFAPAVPAVAPPSADLDLDLDAPVSLPPAPTLPESTRPMPASVDHGAHSGLDLDLDLGGAHAAPAPVAAPAAAQSPMEFDLGALSLDLDSPAAPAAVGGGAAEAVPDLSLPEVQLEGLDANADPLMRKLELAEEFRQIGDTEGARDLLEEVVAKANGSLKAKAQGMLEALA
jgi:pilus assembly protein FimV